MSETLEKQNYRVLEYLEQSPRTTAEMGRIPYCSNFRARVSQLRQMGCRVEATRIPGTNSSRYVLVSRPERLGTLPKSKRKEPRLLTITPAHHIEVWQA